MVKAKKSYKKKAIRRRRTLKVTKTVKKYVARQIARNIENKTYSMYFPTQPVYPSNHANFQAQINPLTPYASYMNIVQGTSQGTRIGNEIKIKKLVFNFVLSPTSYDTVANNQPSPSEVILWIFYDKLNDTQIPTIGNDFLQLGGSAVALTNTLMDVGAPVNTDRYRVLSRRVYKVGFSAYSGTGTLPIYQSFTNNDYKLNVRKSINLMPYIVKNVKFNDNNATPTTRGLFYVFQAVRAAGGPYGNTYMPVNAAVTVDMQYEDA